MVKYTIKEQEKIIMKNKVMEVKVVLMSELLPNDYNPNRFSGGSDGAMMSLLKNCIVKYGF